MFERFRNRRDDDRLEIKVLVVPNGIVHKYYTPHETAPLTATPHTEFLGHDMGRVYHEAPMDTETQLLYDAVKALSNRIESVSVHPHRLDVEGPSRVNRNHYIRGDWPKGLDSDIVQLLARHLGANEATMSVRHQSEQELWDHMDGIIAKAVAQGIEPPEGWPYRRHS